MHGTLEATLHVELRPLAALAPIADELRALAARALEPNVFYEPAFALAAQPVFGRDVQAGLVWRRGAPVRLVGFFPVRIERRRYGIPLPIMASWMHPYAPLGTPLVDRDLGEAILEAWLDHVAHDPALPRLWLMPFIPVEGPLARQLDAVLARRGGETASFGQHQRALLAPGADRAGYLDRAVPHKKRKELRRQRKRLAESGSVTCDTAREPAAIVAALGEFLAIESAGWKGAAGTAARDHADVRTFMEQAVAALAGESKARIDRLYVDRRPIAAMVTLQSGATAWAWKIAYDEGFSRASPGVQLLLDVTQDLLDDARTAQADSCATAGHPMIDHVWRERLVLADRLMRVGPDGAAAFRLACTLEGLRRAVIAAAKALRSRLRR